jgi:hypothetical protein
LDGGRTVRGEGIEAELAGKFHGRRVELLARKSTSGLLLTHKHVLASSFTMHHIIYLSWATTPLSDEQLHTLLQQARRRNTEVGVTGFLLYGNNCFLQVLEGDEIAVRSLYEYIKGDARHRDVTAYADKPITQRAFAEWAMAFQLTTPEQFEHIAGYLRPADVHVDAARLSLTDLHLLDLLRSFTQP